MDGRKFLFFCLSVSVRLRNHARERFMMELLSSMSRVRMLKVSRGEDREGGTCLVYIIALGA